jgi:hemoglobin
MAIGAQMVTLLERMGGRDVLIAVVDEFYIKVMDDPLLRPFFKRSNMKDQRRRQVNFLSSVLLGTAEYAATYLRNIHRAYIDEMGLNDRHYVAFTTHLAVPLAELGIAPALVREIMRAVDRLEDFILGREQQDAA